MQMQSLYTPATQPFSTKRVSPSEDFSTNNDSKRVDHKETPRRTTHHEE